MIIVGIDPGNKGAICFLETGRKFRISKIKIFSMPTNVYGFGRSGAKKFEMDIRGVNYIFKSQLKPDVVVIEYPPIIPHNGSIAIAGLFRSFGELKAICLVNDFSILTPSPKVWKAAILPDTTKDKIASAEFVMNTFPGINIKDPKNPEKILDGFADSLCLAEFGRRVKSDEILNKGKNDN